MSYPTLPDPTSPGIQWTIGQPLESCIDTCASIGGNCMNAGLPVTDPTEQDVRLQLYKDLITIDRALRVGENDRLTGNYWHRWNHYVNDWDKPTGKYEMYTVTPPVTLELYRAGGFGFRPFRYIGKQPGIYVGDAHCRSLVMPTKQDCKCQVPTASSSSNAVT